LLVTSDPDVLEEVLRLAATAGIELEVAVDGSSARRSWVGTPLVLIGPDQVSRLARSRLSRRSGVVVVGRDLDDASSGSPQASSNPTGSVWWSPSSVAGVARGPTRSRRP